MDCDESSKVSLAEHDDVFAAEQSSSEEADGPGSVCGFAMCDKANQAAWQKSCKHFCFLGHLLLCRAA